MKRVVLIAAAGLAIGLLVIGLGAAYLLKTESGLQWLAARGAGSLPEGVTLGEVRGTLLGPLELHDTQVVTAAATVSIALIRIEWIPGALLDRELHLTALTVRDVDVMLAESDDPPDTPIELPAVTLPVRLAVDSLDAANLRLGGEPLISTLTLRLEAEDDRLRLQDLQVDAAAIAVEGELRLTAADRYPLDLTLGIRLAPDGLPALAGKLSASGDLDDVAITLGLEPPYGLAFDGRATDLLGEPAVEGRLTLVDLALERIDAAWPAFTASGEIGLAASLTGIVAHPDLRARGQNLPDLALAGTVSAQRDEVMLEGVTVSLSEPPLVVTLDGALNGTPDAFELSLRSGLKSEALPAAARIAVHGSGNATRLDIATLEVFALGGRITGSASADWRDAVSYRAAVSIEDLDPATLLADWPGALAAQLKLDGTLTDSGPAVTADITALEGRLRGEPLSGHGAVAYAPGRVDLRAVSVLWGGARLEADGTLAAAADLDWQLRAEDLGRLLPDASGSLVSEGHVAGTLADLQVHATLEGRDLAVGEVTVGEASVDASIDLDGSDPSHVEASIVDIAVPGRRLSQVRIDARGTPADHSGTLDAQAPGLASLHAGFSGAASDSGWDGYLQSLRLTWAGEDEPWQIQAPAAITASATAVSVDTACVTRLDNEFCTRGDWSAETGLAASASLRGLRLGRIASVLAPELIFSGEISGDLDVTHDGAGWRIEGGLGVSPGAVSELDHPDVALLDWQSGRVDLTVTPGLAVAAMVADLTDRGTLSVDARLPLAPDALGLDPDGPLDVRLRGQLSELPLLSVLFADISAVSGQAKLDLALAGTPRTPQLSGTAALSDISATLGRLGIDITDTRLTLEGDGDALLLTGSARSGDGQLDVEGRFTMVDDAWRGTLMVGGERFRASNLPWARADISPAMSVEIDGRTVRLGGELVVPFARLRPPDLSDAVQVSPDQRILGDAAAGTEEEWLVYTRVRMTLGDDVRFDGFGLTGRIEGSVLAVDEPLEPTTGSGELRFVDGIYRTAGRNLDIERGRLLFTGGPIDNPALDVRATRIVGSITVGADLRGPLQSPELTLRSDPAMPQAEIVSYLVTGGSMSTAQRGAQRTVDAAAGQRTAHTDDESGPSVAIGTYLSPKLYVSYGLGVFESVNTLLARYSLTRRLTLQTETGVEHSADVFYTIER